MSRSVDGASGRAAGWAEAAGMEGGTNGTSTDTGKVAEGVDGTNSSNRALVGVGGSCSRGDLWANTGSLLEVGDVTGGRIGDPSKDLDDDIWKAKDSVERTVKAGEMGDADLDKKEC